MAPIKQPDITRQIILEAADEEIHHNGFRAASLGSILKKTGVTKGALYHHFPNKLALGYAVLEEVIGPRHWAFWGSMETTDDPIACGNEVIDIHLEAAKHPRMVNGCALSNLSTEMSPVDEGFRTRILCMISRWHGVVSDAFERGQANGSVRTDIKAKEAAAFFLASMSGSITVAKNAQSIEVFVLCLNGMRDYLRGLRPDGFKQERAAT